MTQRTPMSASSVWARRRSRRRAGAHLGDHVDGGCGCREARRRRARGGGRSRRGCPRQRRDRAGDARRPRAVRLGTTEYVAEKAGRPAISVGLEDAGVVVAKGGITSAELARMAIGATRARVRGQVLAGVSVWDLVSTGGDELTYVVVPGNVGGPETLTDILGALGR